MKRLEAIFARASGRRLVIPYVCAGDPDIATSRGVIGALAHAGAEIVEVGMPFSDPVGDGKTIARAAQRALDSGTTLAQTLELCASTCGEAAIVLFGYLNPIVRYGVERFARDAKRAGVAGAIVADLPYEETSLLATTLRASGIALVLIASPTTPLDRAVRIAQASDAFVYVVSRLGVTGASSAPDIQALQSRLEALRARVKRPIAVGFGLSNSSQIALLAPAAEALVVGSALVDAVAGRVGSDASAAAERFLRPLVAAARTNFSRTPVA